MRLRRRHLAGSFAIIALPVIARAPMPAAAQDTVSPEPPPASVAPSGGLHAGRPLDTGFSGAANASGGFGVSVPVDLPLERAGLPVPAQLVYGGRGVGTAGIGWDVPFSYVQRDTTIAHRLPSVDTGGLPIGRERVTLMLMGRST